MSNKRSVFTILHINIDMSDSNPMVDEDANATPAHDETNSFVESKAAATAPYPPSFFTDDKGNLKFVNLIVRRPILVFSALIALCFASIFINVQAPIAIETDAVAIYDLKDARSVAYDSLDLAKEELEKAYELFAIRNNLTEAKKIQESSSDITYWIYEAKTEDGLFNKEALSIMRDIESTIVSNSNYSEYCQLQYFTDSDGNELSKCKDPLSVTNIFYASEWNSTLVQDVIAEMIPQNILRYRELAPCIEFNLFCDSINNEAEKNWAREMDKKFDKITASWDGKGDLNPDIIEVTNFIDLIYQLETKSYLVNFYLDEGYTSSKVSMFSRSIYHWGELLNGTKNAEESDDNLVK